MARDEGWLAEHMLILGVESPDGEKTYVAAAFPSACGKTNFAMLIPPHGLRRAGRSRPSATTSPGSSPAPTASSTPSTPRPASSASPPARRASPTPTRWRRSRATRIFTNVALTDDGDVWWEGMTEHAARTPDRLAGQDWTPDCGAQGRPPQHPLHRARHRSARRSTRRGTTRRACRSAAFIFGGRRSNGVPLVSQAFNWSFGVYSGRHDGLGDDGRRRRQARPGPPRPVRHAAVLRLPHGRLLQPLAAVRAAASPTRRASSTSTGSATTRTASSSGPASARTCAC